MATRSSVAALGCVGLFACCATPTLAPALGKQGVYVHAGGEQTVAAAGLVAPPEGWPPTLAPPADCDEIKTLETDLGVSSKACPRFQRADVAQSGNVDKPVGCNTGGDADQPADGGQPGCKQAASGFNLFCYDLGHALLVVEFQQSLTQSKCKHVVGVSVFRKQ